jgi:glycine/D-amino acid oxidase-like deaminating enzyme
VAQALLKLEAESVNMLREAAARASVPIDLELPGHLTLARDSAELATLREEARLLAGVGETAKLVGQAEVPVPLRSTYIGGLRSKGGFVHSGRLTQAFAQLAVQAGATLCAPAAVRAIYRDGHEHRVMLLGGSLHAQQVVVATNGFTRRLLPTLAIWPQRGQMMVTTPVPPVLTEAMSAREGFDYFHQRRDGRLVIGGGRDLDFAGEATDDMGLNDVIQDQLTHLANALAARPVEVQWRWSGIMGFTNDHLPLAGPLNENLYICAGFSGHGVVMAPAVGRMLADAVLGASPPALSPFAPTRPSLIPKGPLT